MANKKWSFIVSFCNPEDIAKGVTPAKRREEEFVVDATTVPRALSIAKKHVAGEWAVEAKDVVFLDVVREDSPLVAEWADA